MPGFTFGFTVQFYLQHYTEPSSDPVPVTSPLSNGSLPLGSGTFTHNHSGIPIIITCTKADLIDECGDLAAGTTGMGGMVKGKGGEWEERTDGIMQVLRTICLKCNNFWFRSPVQTKQSQCRWRSTILYHTGSSHVTSSSAVCPSSPVCSPRTISRIFKYR
jgi:hypothetical protein